MGERPAGYRYPHATTDARDADHRFCPVLEAVRARVGRGAEDWGKIQNVSARLPTPAAADDVMRGLYRARNHTGKKRGACGGQALSVQAGYYDNTDGTFSVWFRVWDRATAKKYLAARVQAGEQLAYNVMRRT
jgi:hypothetical protein